MTASHSRRRFLERSAAGLAVAGLGDLGFLSQLRPVSAAETELDPRKVRFGDDIEPLVRLLEDTPRDRLLEEVGQRLRQGLEYRELLAALLLAGVRNVEPRPSVGFKFHGVLVVNSAHVASLSSPEEHRWLPIFWALDYFKETQRQDERENNWTMAPVDEARVPGKEKARSELIAALDTWNDAGADAAVAGLTRTATPEQIFELLFRYGARDFRSIGHKAIYAANSWRTLEKIGWQHAEPVLRSLVYAFNNAEGDRPAERDEAADRPWRRNLELAKKIRGDWQEGGVDAAATRSLLSTLRDGSADDACDQAVELLNGGAAPQALWDALFVGAGELLVRQSGIVALHAVTSTNALAFAYNACRDDETRRLLLLQNAAFLPLFRDAMGGRGGVRSFDIESLAATAAAEGAAPAIDAIFADVGDAPQAAAEQTLAYLNSGADAKPLIDAARLLVFLKGSNAHDYKFSSAVLEDYGHVSPEWRNRYLAASMFMLRGSRGADNRLVQRTRSALG